MGFFGDLWLAGTGRFAIILDGSGGADEFAIIQDGSGGNDEFAIIRDGAGGGVGALSAADSTQDPPPTNVGGTADPDG